MLLQSVNQLGFWGPHPVHGNDLFGLYRFNSFSVDHNIWKWENMHKIRTSGLSWKIRSSAIPGHHSVNVSFTFTMNVASLSASPELTPPLNWEVQILWEGLNPGSLAEMPLDQQYTCDPAVPNTVQFQQWRLKLIRNVTGTGRTLSFRCNFLK